MVRRMRRKIKIKSKNSMFWQLSWKVAVLCVVVFIVGCFFTDPLSWGMGVLVGGGFTIIRLKWMDYSVEKAVTGDPSKASGYMTRSYFARYLATALVLVATAKVPWISLYSAMISMFMLKIATFAQGFFEKKVPKDGSVQFEEWVDEEEEEEEEWDRWETYNLRATRKKARQKGKIERDRQKAAEALSEAAVEPVSEPDPQIAEPAAEEDDGEQLSLFD